LEHAVRRAGEWLRVVAARPGRPEALGACSKAEQLRAYLMAAFAPLNASAHGRITSRGHSYS
jgi:hypothetical protein